MIQAKDLYYFRERAGRILATVELGESEHDIEIDCRWYDDEEVGTGRTCRRPDIRRCLMDGQEIDVEGDLEERLNRELTNP